MKIAKSSPREIDASIFIEKFAMEHPVKTTRVGVGCLTSLFTILLTPKHMK